MTDVLETVVQKTVEHDKFYRDEENNRPVDWSHVEALVDAIKKKNLLHLFPIVVTCDGAIIDGQHRWEAARRLGLPIYYVISREMTVIDAAEQPAKVWTNEDRLSHYANRGYPDYITLREFWQKYSFFSLMVAAKLCNYESATKNTKNFRKGLYKANDVDFAVKVAEALLDFKKWGKSFWRHTHFVYAISNLMGNRNYDHRIMMERMEGASTKLVKCPDVASYIGLLNEIYNYRARSNRVELRKLMSNDADFRVDRKRYK